MRVIRREEVYEPGDSYRLWGLGDFHAGAIDFDEAQLRKHVKEIAADPFARVVLMGDYGDLIDPAGTAVTIRFRYRNATATRCSPRAASPRKLSRMWPS